LNPKFRVVVAGSPELGDGSARVASLAAADIVVIWRTGPHYEPRALAEACSAASFGVPYVVAGPGSLWDGGDMHSSEYGPLLAAATILVRGEPSAEDACELVSRAWANNPKGDPMAFWDPKALRDAIALAGSPIEEKLAFHLFSGWRPWDGTAITAQRSVVTGDGVRYRLDLAIESESIKIAIECDGHNFHERTKEQAQHDKSRDRALVASGWRVLRFTGSEIWADPGRCAAEVHQLLRAAGAAS
jgi:very-short-patch-repair endonuclease